MIKLFGWRAVLMLFFVLWVGFVLWWYIFHIPSTLREMQKKEAVTQEVTAVFDAVNKQNKIKLKERLNEGYIDSCDVNCTHGM